MPVYDSAIVKLTDDSWIPDNAAAVHEIAAKHGGRYLSRSGSITTVEGEPRDADMIALIEFPLLESAQAFYDDPEYAPYPRARIAGTVSGLYAIDYTDATGGTPCLAKR